MRAPHGSRPGAPPGTTSEDGEPDYRFALANERTFLAWLRTSLSLLAAGVAVVQLVPDLSVVAMPLLGVTVVLLSALIGLATIVGGPT